MSLARSVAHNTVIHITGRIVSVAIALAVVSLLTRQLGQAGYGQYATVNAFLSFVSVVADLGLALVLVRELALRERPEEVVLGNIVGLRLAVAVVLLVLGAAAALAFPYPPIVKTSIWVAVAGFTAMSAVQLLTGLFQVRMKMVRVVAAEIGGRLTLLGATAWALWAHASLPTLVAAAVAGSIVNLLLALAGLRGLTRLRLRFDFAYWRTIWVIAFPLAVSVVLNLIYFRIDSIFLSVFKPASAVGLYVAAYKILEVLVTFPTLFIGLVLPTLSATAGHDPQRFRHVFQRTFDVLALAAFPLLVGGLILARPLVTFVAGPEFAVAAPTFRLLLIAVACLFFGALSGHSIVAIQKQRVMVRGYLAVAVIGVISYLVLIPPLSTIGAALGTILTEATIMLIGYIVVLKTVRFRLAWSGVGRVLLATAIMAAVLWLVRGLAWPVQLALGAASYGAAALAVGAVRWHEIRNIIGSNQDVTPESPPA